MPKIPKCDACGEGIRMGQKIAEVARDSEDIPYNLPGADLSDLRAMLIHVSCMKEGEQVR